MVIDLYAKNQVNICKCLGRKSGKLILADRLTDGGTNLKSPLTSLVGDYKTITGSLIFSFNNDNKKIQKV